MTENVAAERGSFRDPAGHVFRLQNRILRTVTDRAAQDYEFLRDKGLLARWVDEEWIVGSEEVDPAKAGCPRDKVRYVLEHPALPLISYPYEWPFSALKAAAVFHTATPQQRVELVMRYHNSTGAFEKPAFIERTPVGADPLWVVMARGL